MRATSLQHQAAAEDAIHYGEPTLAAVRVACGFQQQTIAAAAGVCELTVWRWENGKRRPQGVPGARYARIMAGLARHLEISSDE